jgi:predicted O-methyltransferase YrrM
MVDTNEKIKRLVQGIKGWTSQEQLISLYFLVKMSNMVGNVLEIGSYCGKSSTVLAEALLTDHESKLYCVDVFPELSDWYQNKDKSWSFKTLIDDEYILGCQGATMWDAPFQETVKPTYYKHSSLLEIFQENMLRNNHLEKIVTIRGNSNKFDKLNLNLSSFKLIYLDGDHGFEQVYQDLLNVEKYLMPGGFLCFDDAFSGYNGVDRVIESEILNNKGYHNFEQVTRKMFIAQKVRETQ